MPKFKITISKEHGRKRYTAIVDADDEKSAFLKAKDKAEEDGVELPDEVWVRTEVLSEGK